MLTRRLAELSLPDVPPWLASRPRWMQAGLIAALVLVVVVPASLMLRVAMQPALPPVRAVLPGQQIWRDGASSLLFGTNDTYEWSAKNLETSPAIQQDIHAADFTLMRSFFPDSAGDRVIETRMATIEATGANCLGVIPNIFNTAYDEHLVSYLGPRCLLYELGNEPDYTGVTIENYLTQWNLLIPKLRQINPAARFIGPVTSNAEGKNGFMRAFLEGVKTSGVLPDAVSFHWYPCWKQSRDDCLAQSDSYYDAALTVRRMVHDVLGKDLPVGISEWNYAPGNPPPAFGDEATFITQFTQHAIAAMVRAGVAFAAQFDAASYSGYGRLDMFNVETGEAKPQFTALAGLIAHYRLGGGSANKGQATAPGTGSNGKPSGSFGALLSRNKPVYCSANNSGPGGPGTLDDGRYGDWGFWRTDLSALPAWCAVQVGAGASQLLLVWSSDYVFDYLSQNGMAPRDYTIAVSADSTNGADGSWQTIVTVTDNDARVREHLIPFAGKSWVKLTVTRGQPQASQPYVVVDEIEAYDVSHGLDDTFLFSGDSLTGMAYNRFDGNVPAFADDVHAAQPARYPPMLDEGFGGWSSDGALQELDHLLALNPDIHYWLLGWGTNDALAFVSPEHFALNLQQLVDRIRGAGHVPILAHIPYVKRPGADGAHVDRTVRALNAVIDQIAAANGLLRGPDLYTLVKAQAATYLLPDGIHPTPEGAVAMNEAWFKTLQPLFP
ncbi:MAG TPA: GDSL-type esterase/lipase family protein [Ktedonobacterales bacterium]|nr:GDSL-type esterase/lipase family protein [Ktedonobacterales bacterium]